MAQSNELFPEAIYEFARTQNLGVPEAEYLWDFNRTDAIVMPIMGFALTSLTLVTLLNLLSARLANILPGLPGLLLILMMDVGGIWYFVSRLRRRSLWCVYVFTNGFAYLKKSGEAIFRWEEVSHIREHVTLNRYGQPLFYSYRVERTDGYVITLDSHLRAVHSLGRTIMQRVNAARL